MKKLLSILGSIGIVAVSASTIVSCSTSTKFNQDRARQISNRDIKAMENVDLGALNNLSPLTSENDANIFNSIGKGTLVHQTFGTDDYSTADDKIGSYEVAKVLFKHFGVRFDYNALFGFKFILSKDESRTNGYKMIVRADDGQEITCRFTSNKDVQPSLNSVIDDSKEIHVKDGNIHTIAKALEQTSKDKSVDLDVWNRQNPNGINSITIDDNNGIGTVQLFDKSGKYGGYIYPKIVIDNYQKVEWDGQGNRYSFYNDRTADQNKAINDIDEHHADTELDPDKHVILFGLDGIRQEKFMSMMKPMLNSGYHVYGGPDDGAEGGYYSQPSESMYGWKTDLTGSVSGDSTNIFDMINNSKNGKDMYAYGNFSWSAFRNDVFGRHNEKGSDNVKRSFNKSGSYIDLNNNPNIWLDAVKNVIKTNPKYKDVKIPSYHGAIDTMAFKDIWNATKNEVMFSAAKTQAIYDISMEKFENVKNETGNYPNLVFDYDTEADDEGHAFDNSKMSSFNAYYKSDVLKQTFSAYADIMNDAYSKYGTNPNYLILQIVDHGRNSGDGGHSPYDPDARKGWMVSNLDNLQDYISTKNANDINQYSIKEIIWNFLKK